MSFLNPSRSTLGRQGVDVCDNFTESQAKKYLNYLIRTIQWECQPLLLADISDAMSYRYEIIDKEG